MTSEETVLNYVAAGLGGPRTIKADLRGVYHELMEVGLIEAVTVYQLTDAGKKALEAVWRRQDGEAVGQGGS